jgi:hypothetical protein
VPTCRTACSAASRPTVAERRRRDVGIGFFSRGATSGQASEPRRAAR